MLPLVEGWIREGEGIGIPFLGQLVYDHSTRISPAVELSNLVKCLAAGITLWHPATEPVSAAELYEYLSGGQLFVNELPGKAPACYDYKTIHAELFGGSNGYIKDKATVLEEIKTFVL